MNTRFNPTLSSGLMHIGHYMMVLVNEYTAHSQGGKFLVRFDDNQFWWQQKYGPKELENYANLFREDLDWLKVEVDEFSFQSKREDEYDTMLMKLNRGPLPVQCSLVSCLEGPDSQYTTSTPYPFAPDLTANHVILDFLDEINPLVRGEDLVDESSLYDYFCRLWRLPRPKQVYLSRLRIKSDEDRIEEISKTQGDYTIRSFRAMGMKWDDLQCMVALACQKERGRCWDVRNIRREPLLIV